MLKSKILSILIVLVGGSLNVVNAHNSPIKHKDPTKPPLNIEQGLKANSQDAPEVVYMLNAVKISGNNRSAIINGEKYVVGQVIAATRIKSISSNSVLLVSGKVLSLFDDELNNVTKKGY